ncbi:TonB-dependent receptor [Confluentibacter lentus]|uniref:TonB-dependent receptor n=1 Tax=Confluentibacter lentus TaxID=1699412 RepID=UPI000C2853A2|nr:TonB-dependent receptor [Confluentibacter lentus]
MKTKKIIIQVTFIFTIQFAFPQHTISGYVYDESTNEPLSGANILIRETTNGVITGIDGSFKIDTRGALPLFLDVSYLGFESKAVELTEWINIEISLKPKSADLNEVTVTARRRTETAQNIPIPISIVGGAKIEDAGAFNVNLVKELVPSVQLYTSNPRNTGINIRGLGSPFGLTNDGLDSGVGFYVDGVYFARPAVATLDFIDIDCIEVLRGPQGTLFGKNTTAGAFNITTRKASFTPGANFEVSYGNYGFIQAKASVTGGIIKDKLAARVSFSGTQRDGNIYNIAKDEYVNDINNLGFRGQLLFTPSDKIKITFIGDNTRQNPNGFAQVVAGVVQTQRAAYRQFNNIIADLNYTLPSTNAFDRVIDHDTPWRSLNELGGVSLNADFELGKGTLTSTTAWRYWNWGPSNDRDFTGLQALAKSQNPAKHENWSQEIRYAGDISSKLSGVVGLFFIDQEVKIDGTEESGTAQWRFSQNSTSELWETPGLLEGYGIRTDASIKSSSAAVFANIDWAVTDKLHILPGVRFNYDEKQVYYNRVTYGGLETTDPALLALKRVVYTNQFFETGADETNFTYQLTASYKVTDKINAYATYSTSYKPVGVNVAGLPVIDGAVAVDLGTIKPEYVKHVEVGLKTSPAKNINLNATFFNTNIEDYQANVQAAQLGVNRGYISNAEKVNSKGVELDANVKVNSNLSFNLAVTYTDAKYEKFTNAPVPLEEVGGAQAYKDISGGRLPGISKWAGSFGGELTSNSIDFLSQQGKFFLGFDSFFRSEFSSSASPSQFLNIQGYGIVNARAGFRATDGLSLFVWARNLLDKDYYEQLLPAGGSAGHYAAVLGDPGTYGVTLRYSF